jgi:hypothetical protein
MPLTDRRPLETAAEFHLSEEESAELLARQAAAKAGGKQPKRRKRSEIEFFRFPAAVLQAVRIAAGGTKFLGPVHAAMFAIYEIRYEDYDHPQTVKLTNAALKRHSVSRRQKPRVLQILVKSGQYAVEFREECKNPWVTELWRPFWN